MLTTELIRVLTNFAQIETSFIAQPGSRCTTMNTEKTIFASYECEDELFPKELGIYDLAKFLSVIKLMTKVSREGIQYPEIEFDEKFLILRSADGNELKYFFADVSVLPKPPIKPPAFPADPEVVFSLSTETIKHLQTVSSTLGCDHLMIYPEDGTIHMQVTDINNASTNVYTEKLDPNDVISVQGDTFNIIYDLNRWKLDLESPEYLLQQSSKLISQFIGRLSATSQIEYWIGQEFKSSYE